MAASMNESVRKRTRVVGWLDQEEWQYVYDNFYSDDYELQKSALDRYAAWKSRVTTKIPLSIACTAGLVEAGILEKQGANKECIRLAYAMALIRFVNMTTDRYQNKFFAQPVHVIAKEIGVPVWLVNLRHDATHSELPSLSILKTGVEFALSWLQTDYWEKNEDTDSESEMDPRAQLRQLLIRYQQEQYMILQMGWSQSNDALVEVLADISEIIENEKAIHVFDILLQDGFLVPTEQQLQSLAIETNINTKAAELPQIPEKFVNLWQPLLQQLCQMKILHSILEPLCKELCKYKTPMMQSGAYLLGWMRLFLEVADKNLCGIDCSQQSLTIAPTEVDWHHLFNLCVESPNPYTCQIVQRLVDYLKPPLTPEVKANVTDLTVIYLNQFNLHGENEDEMTNNKGKTDKEVETPQVFHEPWQPFSIDKIDSKYLQSSASDRNKVQTKDDEVLRSCDKHCEAWQRSKADIQWSQYPLGRLPGQLSHPEYLLLKPKSGKLNNEDANGNNMYVICFKL
ncbi:ribosomal biogenesis protein LAS1L-like [Anneissia japonica]|uniref:ribosomal biogenesis protein LAS1L-like n=1 Tax=Anneissia japonica TaxID=1529436 RepID=UPI0014259101|nr:ribosomal biogenesis protein LAS1L-like [Anneissia japonica]